MNEHEKHEIIGELIVAGLGFVFLTIFLIACALIGGVVFGFGRLVIAILAVACFVYCCWYWKDADKK